MEIIVKPETKNNSVRETSFAHAYLLSGAGIGWNIRNVEGE